MLPASNLSLVGLLNVATQCKATGTPPFSATRYTNPQRRRHGVLWSAPIRASEACLAAHWFVRRRLPCSPERRTREGVGPGRGSLTTAPGERSPRSRGGSGLHCGWSEEEEAARWRPQPTSIWSCESRGLRPLTGRAEGRAGAEARECAARTGRARGLGFPRPAWLQRRPVSRSLARRWTWRGEPSRSPQHRRLQPAFPGWPPGEAFFTGRALTSAGRANLSLGFRLSGPGSLNDGSFLGRSNNLVRCPKGRSNLLCLFQQTASTATVGSPLFWRSNVEFWQSQDLRFWGPATGCLEVQKKKKIDIYKLFGSSWVRGDGG
jgi:hypothetical protein